MFVVVAFGDEAGGEGEAGEALVVAEDDECFQFVFAIGVGEPCFASEGGGEKYSTGVIGE